MVNKFCCIRYKNYNFKFYESNQFVVIIIYIIYYNENSVIKIMFIVLDIKIIIQIFMVVKVVLLVINMIILMIEKLVEIVKFLGE